MRDATANCRTARRRRAQWFGFIYYVSIVTLKRYVAFLVIMAAIAAALSGCGSSSKAETTSEVERPSAHKPPASNGNRASAGPPIFHQAEYDLETEWIQDTSDHRAGRYLKSAWHDPCCPRYKLVISSRPSRNFAPPLAAAELSRKQARHLRKYREVSFKKVKIGHPAVRFVYYAGGDDYIEYFFAKCGTSIALQGSTNPGSFKLFSWFYENTASQVKPVCDE
jgi:hypothetical protein